MWEGILAYTIAADGGAIRMSPKIEVYRGYEIWFYPRSGVYLAIDPRTDLGIPETRLISKESVRHAIDQIIKEKEAE